MKIRIGVLVLLVILLVSCSKPVFTGRLIDVEVIVAGSIFEDVAFALTFEDKRTYVVRYTPEDGLEIGKEYVVYKDEATAEFSVREKRKKESLL